MPKNKISLGAIFYPTSDENGNPIPFDSLFLPYIWKEIYFDGVYIDILNQRKDMVILDVGSQVGLTVQHFLPHAKKIYAIEPSKEHFKALKANKTFNGWDKVELFNYALADKDGEMVLHINKDNRTCNSLIVGRDLEGYKVRTVAFDTFFKENKIKEIDFCKFDVEGAEDLILRSEGFRKVYKKIKAILVEFHFPNWQDLAQYMIDLGYKARRYRSNAIIVLFTK